MRPIRIAAQLHPQHGDYPTLRRGALDAEALGYDIVYTWDHFFPLNGPPDGPHLECWTVLGAWAEATTRIEIGPLVSCTSYRNPNLLADMARTVDRISDGRLILGLGAGWFERDYEAYGFEFGTRATRIEHLGRSVEAIRDRLPRLNPPPARQLPLLIAGTGPKRTLRLVAQYADGWHAAFPERPVELRPAVEALHGWCERLGRDPADIEWGVGVEPDDFGRFLAQDAETYLAMGFTQFTLGFGGPEWDVSGGQEWLGWRDARNAMVGRAAELPRAG